ncbi:MAG: hypothetical protein E7329_00540 [Clostridiales bacterium]|nr:hypothetical protein [Clostridiales bacterium]
MDPLYCLDGTVVHGFKNGRKVGMPTANLQLHPGQEMPPFGVYAASLVIDGKEYLGVTNVGLRPTLSGEQLPTIETYILDYSGDLYKQELSLALWAFLRPTRKMASLQEVKEQVEKDAQATRALLEA